MDNCIADSEYTRENRREFFKAEDDATGICGDYCSIDPDDLDDGKEDTDAVNLADLTDEQLG